MTSDDKISKELAAPDTGDEDAPPTPDSEKASAAAFDVTADTGLALLGNEIEIITGVRLPHLDRGPVQAFAARGKGGSKDNYFALICENKLIPRTRHAGAFAAVMNPCLAKLVGSGVVYWPPMREQRYVFVYENNLGRPLLKPGDTSGLSWKQDYVMNAVIKPMVNLMLDLRDADLVHGCINPYNMFDGGSEVIEKVMLGECLSLPPSYALPALFEPVERAMADPIARGMGTFEDDLYSFGVTITMFLRHRDPLEGMTDQEIVRQKIEMGSYGALTGKERFTGAILELLRGLLYDDRAQRWTLDEVLAWLQGQRLSPKQSSKKQKSARPMHFNNERYFRPEMLAMDLDKNPAEAMQIVEGGQLHQWIERSLEDKVVDTRYQQALETSKDLGRGPGYWDLLLSRVSVALDPEAPIRFKNLKVHPDGVPYALAQVFYEKGDLSPFADIISHALVSNWLNAQYDLRVDVGTLVSRYDSCRAFLRQPTIGYGIERCLYYLNREAPCISDKLKGFYVRTPEDMMRAFEVISRRPDRPELFIDRHIAAFLSVKDRKVIDPYFMELNADPFYKRILGNIKTLATIQKRSRMEAFPGIASWIAAILEPVYERYHDRLLRESLKSKVEKLKSYGDITRIAAMFDDAELLKKDFSNFRQAMLDYNAMRSEYNVLEVKMNNPQTFGKDAGREVAAIVSGVLAGIIILGFAFLYLMKHGAM